MPKETSQTSTFQDPSWGRCGFELNLYQAPRADINPLIVLKGGLGDAGSHSLKSVKEAVLDMSNGDMSVATVGTLRPFSLLESLRIVTHPNEQSRARQQRTLSMELACVRAVALTQCKFVLLGGQSEGGVTAVDTGLSMLRSNPTAESPSLAVATIDTPGIYKSLNYEGFPFRGLADLVMHCLPTLGKLTRAEQLRLLSDNLKNPRLLLELPYLLGEINYLKGMGLSDDIAALRAGGLAVGHVFHDQDIVEGAIEARDDPNAVVFPGAHITFMVEPEPVAEVLINMAYNLQENPSSAFVLSDMSRLYNTSSLSPAA